MGNVVNLRKKRDVGGHDPRKGLRSHLGVDPSKVTEDYGQWRSYKSRFHDLWWTCHGFFDGRQYVTFRNGIPIDQKAPSWRIRLTINRVAPIVNTGLAKLTQNPPKCAVKPRGIDPERIQRAKAAMHLLDYLAKPSGLTAADVEVAGWMLLTGSGFYVADWDEDEGHLWQIAPDGEEPHEELTGFPRIGSEQPFNIFVNPSATEFCRAPDFIRKHRLSRDEVEARWPKTFGAIMDARRAGKPSDGSWGDEGEEHWRPDITGYSGDDTVRSGYLNVFEYQRRANREFDHGARAFVCEGALLQEGELPFREFNVFHAKMHPVPGRLWPRGIVEDLLDPQRELNRTASQEVEIRNLHLHPIWLNPSKAMKSDALVNKPDSIVNYSVRSGAKPERVDPPPLPPSLREMVNGFSQTMEELSGIHGVSQGRTESGVVSGRAMATIADQDETKLGPASRSKSEARAACQSHMLKQWREHMVAPVTLSVLGPSRVPEVIELYAADIDSTEVEIVEPGTPTHPSVERDFALQVFAQGGFEDTEAAKRLREALGVKGMQGIEGDDNSASLYAEEENTWLLGDDEVMAARVDVGWPDDDECHLRRHLRAYESRRYRLATPDQQYRLRHHMGLHYKQATLKGLQEPVYAADLGEEIPALMGQPSPMAPGAAPQPGPPQPASPSGGMGGGTPELNGATGPAASPAGPGANAHEEMTGTY